MTLMKKEKYLNLTIYLLIGILPLSALGYYFAVENESLFYLYQWLLSALIVLAGILAIKCIVSLSGGLKWVAIAIFVFLLEFSVLGLFLGPFTHFLMIYLYYLVALISLVVFITAIKKSRSYRYLPVIFILFTGLTSIYVIFLNLLWGNNLS
ncbi:hypothetical protein [Mesobacillus foraminis]|uniref:Uncharacterized protein n=1 Tax=Mesobacillus foraminis TaxID=279826 RepID=A0A4R2B224_9BACI|nr:hypothetical protein [Mesobacillus foraminis]TCN20491.1 hypothetical protein EV146_114111 [Mesobacillus foraminis]